MYRHFLLRVCDVANTARIVDSGQVDFEELREASEVAGIWSGVATYLNIISQYMEIGANCSEACGLLSTFKVDLNKFLDSVNLVVHFIG
jgi:hypothetical protein